MSKDKLQPPPPLSRVFPGKAILNQFDAALQLMFETFLEGGADGEPGADGQPGAQGEPGASGIPGVDVDDLLAMVYLNETLYGILGNGAGAELADLTEILGEE